MRLPAPASCLGRHSHPAGRCPNSSSLFRPLAAVVAVALGCFCAVFSDVAAAVRIHPRAPLETDTKQKAQRNRPHWERQLWDNCGFASRAAKNSPLGCFCAVFSDVAAAVRIHPRLWPQRSYIRKTPVYFYTSVFLVGAGGFEPPKLKAADLQSVPIGHSGTRPYSLFAVLRTACIYYHRFSSLSIFFVQIFRFLRCPAGSTPAPVLLARLFAYRSFVWLPAAFPCMDRRWRVPSFGPSAGPSFPALQQKPPRNQRS